MSGFCSNDKLYSTLFDTKDYCFKQSHSLILCIKVFLTQNACNVVFKSSKHEPITFSDEFIFMFVPYFIGAISSEIVVKSWRGEVG